MKHTKTFSVKPSNPWPLRADVESPHRLARRRSPRSAVLTSDVMVFCIQMPDVSSLAYYSATWGPNPSRPGLGGEVEGDPWPTINAGILARKIRLLKHNTFASSHLSLLPRAVPRPQNNDRVPKQSVLFRAPTIPLEGHVPPLAPTPSIFSKGRP